MDSGVYDADRSHCNGGSKPYFIEESKKEADKSEEEKGDDDAESKSLLQSAKGVNGGIGTKRQKSTRRRVQWNDRNGNKLVEILEYQPSDSSDSEDDSSSRDWTWTLVIAGWIHVCCSPGDQRSSS